VIVGRYVIGETFASGGMGTVHLGRIRGAGGFTRVVAVKRLYPWLAGDAEFRQMLLDEARFVSRIRHPNVVPTLDVVEADKDLYVVMEYVHGVSLAHVLKYCVAEAMPVAVAAGIVEGVLSGLHAAHEARGEDGTPLGIVHRDVSPQNILVGADGIARLIDFGIAKAATRLQVTAPGVLKGKIGYMAPEQLLREPVSRQTDVYSCGIILWELLTNRRLIEAHEDDPLSRRVKESEDVPPSRYRDGVGAKVDGLVLRALSLHRKSRFPTAEAMAVALREGCSPASSADVARWLHQVAGDDLEISDERVRLVELAAADSSQDLPAPHVISELSDHATPTTKASPRGGVWAWRAVTLGGTLLVAAFAAFALRIAWRQAAPGVGARSGLSVVADPPATAVASAPASSLADVAAPSSFAAPPVRSSAAAPASAALPPPAQPSALQPAAAAAAARAPAVRSARPVAKSRCDPPYTVDASGRKHYDPSCF
jgi:serine/threonine-protein kinase